MPNTDVSIVSMLLLDLDHFKDVNDRRRCLAGDLALLGIDRPEVLDHLEGAPRDCAMYMFSRRWCWPRAICAGPPGPSAIVAWSRAATTSS
jgi:hypothetical protein